MYVADLEPDVFLGEWPGRVGYDVLEALFVLSAFCANVMLVLRFYWPLGCLCISLAACK